MVVVHVQGVTSNATDYGCVVMISDVGNMNFGGCCSKLYQMNYAFWKVQNFFYQVLVIKPNGISVNSGTRYLDLNAYPTKGMLHLGDW